MRELWSQAAAEYLQTPGAPTVEEVMGMIQRAENRDEMEIARELWSQIAGEASEQERYAFDKDFSAREWLIATGGEQ